MTKHCDQELEPEVYFCGHMMMLATAAILHIRTVTTNTPVIELEG